MRKAISFLLLLLFVTVVGRGWYQIKEGFQVQRIGPRYREFLSCRNSYVYHVSGENGNGSIVDSAQLPQILKQPYSYLGKGKQSYAFLSFDQKYVMKFPRLDKYDLPFFWKMIPGFGSYKKASVKALKQRWHFLQNSFQIAGNELSDQTGVFYLHFAKTEDLPKEFILKDPLGRSHTLNLNELVFALQVYHPLLIPKIEQALFENNREDAKKLVNGFLSFLEIRARKGIFNKDASFRKNFSVDQYKAVQIDIGSFYRKALSERDAYRQSLWEGSEGFRAWLDVIDKEMSTYVYERICGMEKESR